MAIKGIGQMQAKLRTMVRDYPDRVAGALFHEAEIEVTEMKRRCPVDTTPDAPHPGNLRDSLHAEPPERDGDRISVVVATGAQAPYDIYVHENPDAFHPIGQWKFMESVLDESAPYMGTRVANRIKL